MVHMDGQQKLPLGHVSAQQFAPVPAAVAAAKSYAKARGGRYNEVNPQLQVNPQVGHAVQRAYRGRQNKPTSQRDRESYEALRSEVNAQHAHMTSLGITHEVVDHDPYKDPRELAADVAQGRIKTLSTAATGSHNFFSDDENDKFRAVHDFFGHVATGRGFCRHGEEAAYQSHAQMFSPKARAALASETRGQNSYLNFSPSGGFPDQGNNLVTMPKWATAAQPVAPNQDPKVRKNPRDLGKQLRLPGV